MPKTRFDRVKRDVLLELILGRKSAMKLSEEILAQKMGVSRSTLRSRLKNGSDSWTLGEIKSCCHVLGIPAEELRSAIKLNQ